MKKFMVFLCAILWLSMVFSTAAFGAPESGTFNEDTLGLIDDFNGIAATLDPGPPFGGTVGDVTMGRDDSSKSGPGYGYYWYFNGLERDTLEEGPIVDNLDGTGTSTLNTTRSGGTFYIRGDNLWGHDPGTIYTATIQNESSGVNHYINNSGSWEWDRYEGVSHIWGYFDDYPYLINFTDHASIIDPHSPTDDPNLYLIVAELTNVNIQIEKTISSFSQVVYSEHRLRYGLDYFGVGTWFGFKDHLDTGYYATISGGPLSGELKLNAPYEFLTGYNEFWYKWPEEDPSILNEFSNKGYSFKLYDSSGTQIVLTNGDEGTVTLTSGIMQKLPFVELTVTTTDDYTTLTWYDIECDDVDIQLYRVDLVNPDPAGPWALATETSWDDDPDEIQSHSVKFYTKELFERYPEITFRVDARQLEDSDPLDARTLVNRSSLYHTEPAPNVNEDYDGDGIPNGSDPDILPDFANNLPLNAIKKSSGVIQAALGSICEDIEQEILYGDCDEAIRKLENIGKRFDGCDDELDMPDKNDWIIDCEAQLELRQWVDMLIDNLTTNGCSLISP